MTQPISDDATAPLPPVPDRSGRATVARVNLLPGEVVKERRRRRVALASVGVLAIYVLALIALLIAKTSEVTVAMQERDTARQRVTMLQAEVAELSEYRELVADIDTREALLTAAMDDELSWARIFGDLALAFSRDASLTQIEAITTVEETADGEIITESPSESPSEPDASEAPPATTDGEVAEDGASDDVSVAQVTFTGYSVEEVAPGVAEVLTNFGAADTFFDTYLTTATDQERGDDVVTGFEGRVELNDRAYTGRYHDGMPQESLQ